MVLMKSLEDNHSLHQTAAFTAAGELELWHGRFAPVPSHAADYHPLSVRRSAPSIKRIHGQPFARASSHSRLADDPQQTGSTRMKTLLALAVLLSFEAFAGNLEDYEPTTMNFRLSKVLPNKTLHSACNRTSNLKR